MCFKLVFFLVILRLINTIQSASKSIGISRCCNEGEVAEITENDLICTTAFKSEWNPKVYSIRKQVYLDKVPQSWKLITNNKPHCGHFNSTLLTAEYFLLESGFLMYDNQKISKEKFCIENNSVLVCLEHTSNITNNSVRVKKCCGRGGVYNPEKARCVLNNETSLQLTTKNNLPVTWISGFPTCINDTVVQLGSVNFIPAGPVDTFQLMDDGGLVSKIGDVFIKSGLFCIEIFLENSDSKVPRVLACPNNSLVSAGLSEKVNWKLSFYATGLIISVIFLIATLVTGYLLPSSHHLLHWRCQTHYVLCLLVGDFFLAVTQLTGHTIHGNYCLTIASLMHFFFLAAFFWLNTMCFNIWWTFRDLRPANLEKGQEACRLRLYELYAWGLPLMIAGVGAIINQLPEEDGYNFLRPRFGERACWFYGDMEIFIYFFGPVGLLLTINLILFALTARELTCGLWKREVVKSNTERAALGRVCLKLVVVMGVSWVADVLSWVAGGPQELWYCTDIINTLQGLFIFIVIGCQPQVWTAVKRMWCLRRNDVNWVTTSRTTGNGNSVTNHQSTIPLETSC